MTRQQLEREVAAATGESMRTIRRRGFSMINIREREFDPEPNDLPAQVIDWDALHMLPERRAA